MRVVLLATLALLTTGCANYTVEDFGSGLRGAGGAMRDPPPVQAQAQPLPQQRRAVCYRQGVYVYCDQQ